MEDRIKEIMAGIFNISVSEIDGDTNPENVDDWDSLCHMKLVFSLEEEFDIQFSDDQIVDLISFEKIIGYVSEIS